MFIALFYIYKEILEWQGIQLLGMIFYVCFPLQGGTKACQLHKIFMSYMWYKQDFISIPFMPLCLWINGEGISF